MKLLSAFGRTNAPELARNLIKDYTESTKDALLMGLRAREEARASQKFAWEAASQERKDKLHNFDEIAAQLDSPEVAAWAKKKFQQLGWIDKDGMIRGEHLQNYPQMLEAFKHESDIVYEANINDLTFKIQRGMEELNKETDPEEKAKLQKRLDGFKNARSNFINNRPMIEDFVAKEKAKIKAQQEADPERYRLQTEEIEASIAEKRALARQRSAVAAAKEGGTDLMTPAATKELQKSAQDIVTAKIINSLPPVVLYEMRGMKGSVDKVFSGPGGLVYIRENYPEEYRLYKKLLEKGEEKWAAGGGKISKAAAMDAAWQEITLEKELREEARYEGVEDVKAKMSTPVGEYGELRFGQGQPARRPEPARYNYKTHIDPNTGITEIELGDLTYNLIPPPGMPEQRVKVILKSIETSISRGATPTDVMHVLKNKMGFTMNLIKDKKRPNLGR